MKDCCERYTDKELKRCMLCGCYSFNHEDSQANSEYLTEYENKTKNGESK